MEKVKKTPRRPAADSAKEKQTQFEQTMYQRNLFLSMALNMTWQLALVVIIPIVGGFKLDQHFGTSPFLAITGVVISAIGVILILRQVVVTANRRAAGSGEDKK